MQTSSVSRVLVLVALCVLAPVCLAQNRPMRGDTRGMEGQGQGQNTVDQFGRPLSGQIPPELAPFDDLVPQLLQKYDIPGCAIAVMNRDQLVMSRGYGWANREGKVPVAPDSLFRIAGLSKTITSAAILMLAQSGKLKLDAPVFDVLNDMKPLDGATPDPRLAKITIRQLLQGSGGWDAGASFDPFDRLAQIALATKQPAPPDNTALIRYMMGQPLQFDPGTKSVNSNFGYLLLGRVIEKVSGIGYEDFVNAQLFTPIGATSFRLAATRDQERDAGEVKYYDYKGAAKVASLFDANTFASRPDGAIGMESRGASEGWVCSAPDFLRFVSVIDGDDSRPDALTLDTLTEMARRPAYALKATSYAGMGWNVDPSVPFDPKNPNDHTPELFGNWWQEGALPGTSAFAGRDSYGRAWVALFNSHPQDDKAWKTDMITALNNAINQSQWPQPSDQNGNNDNRDGQ